MSDLLTFTNSVGNQTSLMTAYPTTYNPISKVTPQTGTSSTYG